MSLITTNTGAISSSTCGSKGLCRRQRHVHSSRGNRRDDSGLWRSDGGFHRELLVVGVLYSVEEVSELAEHEVPPHVDLDLRGKPDVTADQRTFGPHR